mmetsp:Transcript_42068/g.104732  ORF Transcript_42068/g.104732 Transcript_42068/m.104732 type:complete len:82 (+) Transcript_42068:1536-1781(+)
MEVALCSSLIALFEGRCKHGKRGITQRRKERTDSSCLTSRVCDHAPVYSTQQRLCTYDSHGCIMVLSASIESHGYYCHYCV